MMATTPMQPTRLTDAQRQMVEDHLGLVGYILNRYGHKGFGFSDDAFQTGVIGLMRAATRYDSRKSKFSTFAARCILNELRHERRKQCVPQRGGGTQPLSLDTLGYADGEDQANLMEMLASNEPSVEESVERSDLVRRLIRLLEQAPLAKDYFLSDATQDEVAKRHGVSQTYVSQSIRRAIRFVRKRLTEEGEVIS